jgi:hypothetical protein
MESHTLGTTLLDGFRSHLLQALRPPSQLLPVPDEWKRALRHVPVAKGEGTPERGTQDCSSLELPLSQQLERILQALDPGSDVVGDAMILHLDWSHDSHVEGSPHPQAFTIIDEAYLDMAWDMWAMLARVLAPSGLQRRFFFVALDAVSQHRLCKMGLPVVAFREGKTKKVRWAHQ